MTLRFLATALCAAGLTIGAAQAQTVIPPAPAKTAPAAPAAAPRAPAAQGQQAQIPPPVDKATMSYAVGAVLAQQTMSSGVDLDQAQLIRGIQDVMAKKQPLAYPNDKLSAAAARYEYETFVKAKAAFDKASAENKAKTDAMLNAQRGKPGVISGPGGILYRVIEPGTGIKPGSASIIDVHYTVSAPGGQMVTSTLSNPKPATGKVSEFPVPGIREILPLMPAGSRWEVYLPADKAGLREMPGLGLTVEVRLIAVK